MFKRYWWMLLVMAPVGMIAGLMLAAVVTYVMPKKYESFATIEVSNRSMVRGENGESMHLQIQTTDFEVIKSRNTLSKVIDSLDLTTRWGVDRETALGILKRIVQTQNIKATDLIQIRVMHTDKEEARDIAAAVAAAYRDYRMELHASTMEKGINAIRKAVREQEDKVEEKRKVLTTGAGRGYRIKQKDILNQPEPEKEALEQPTDITDYAEAKRDFEYELSMLEQMKINMMREEIIQDLPNETVVIHDDPVIADSPASPNVTLNLVAGTFGGLLLSPFLALPLMWFMSRRKR